MHLSAEPVPPQSCPLCNTPSARHFYADKLRRYFQCPTCALIFADRDSLLMPTSEKAIYDQHENSPDDQRYRDFLDQLAKPLCERLDKRALHGLDFGCGPGPALPVMLEEMGYNMAMYDPYFLPDSSTLTRQYDFITCTEAIEHFYSPGKEWQLLLDMLKPGGWLGLMTSLASDVASFAQWHYKNDPTHVSFFSHQTFIYLSNRDKLELEFIGNNVILLKKPGYLAV